MNLQQLKEYFETLFNVRGEKRGSLAGLFTVEGVAYLICFVLTSGVPSETDMARILTRESECNISLYYSIILAIVLISAVAANPCHPILGLTVNLSRFFCKIGLEGYLMRRLFPWEAALIDTVCFALWRVVFGKPVGLRRILSRGVVAFLRGTVVCLAAFILDQLIDGQRLGSYLLKAFQAARAYAQGAASFLAAQTQEERE